jgi:hypothetical protein
MTTHEITTLHELDILVSRSTDPNIPLAVNLRHVLSLLDSEARFLSAFTSPHPGEYRYQGQLLMDAAASTPRACEERGA